LRNTADYQTSRAGQFHDAAAAQQAVRDAEDAITILNQIEADPARRSAAITAVQATIRP